MGIFLFEVVKNDFAKPQGEVGDNMCGGDDLAHGKIGRASCRERV